MELAVMCIRRRSAEQIHRADADGQSVRGWRSTFLWGVLAVRNYIFGLVMYYVKAVVYTISAGWTRTIKFNINCYKFAQARLFTLCKCILIWVSLRLPPTCGSSWVFNGFLPPCCWSPSYKWNIPEDTLKHQSNLRFKMDNRNGQLIPISEIYESREISLRAPCIQ